MKDPHQDEMTRIYNKHAEKYHAQVMDFEFPNGMYEKFLEELSWKKILDIGCGFGREISKLRNNWYEAYGIELSENMISYANKQIQQYITLWDITELEKHYSDNDFDGIISSASIVHMEIEIWKEVLQKTYKLLREKWILFLSLKVSEEEKTIFKNSLSIPWVGKKYVYYKESDIENFLKELWFDIVHKHSWTPVEDTWNVYICKK